MVQKPQSLVCPSCGAPLKVKEDETRVECQYCHATVELPEDEQPPILISPPTIEYHYVQPRRRLGWIFILVLLLVVGAFALPFILIASTTTRSTTPGVSVYSITSPLLLPGSNQVLGITYNSDETRRPALLDFDQSNPLLWQAEDLGDEAYRARFLVTETQVVAAMDARLFALNRTDGALLWETSLSDALPVGCEGCLQEADGRLFALTQLGTLHAYDLASGQQIWNTGLEETPRELYLFGSGPAVVDTLDGTPTIVIFDPASGQRLQEIAPTCPNHVFEDDPQEMDSSPMLWTDADRRYFYLAYGFWEPGCLEKWDAQSGERLYQSLLPEDLVRGDLLHLQAGDLTVLAPASGSQVWLLENVSGEARQLVADENYNLRPVALQGQVVVVEAKRSRGSARYELWGISTASGERLWQFIPQGEEPASENITSIIDSGGVYAVQALPGGLALLQAFDDPARITLETLNFQTGVSQGQVSYTPKETSIFSLEVIGWRENQVWLQSDGLLVLEINSGKRLYSWP